MSIKYYRDLLKQTTRIEGFRSAIQSVVRPGDRVLEVGAGLGTFAFFAADAGAGHVWAVDGDPAVHVARAIAQSNGYDGKVELIRGWIPYLELPERADVVVFEDYPARLLDGRTHRLYRHVFEQYAGSGARAIPSAARVFLAPVSDETVWREISPFDDADEAYAVQWAASRYYLENTPLAVTVPQAAVVAAPTAGRRIPLDTVPDAVCLRIDAAWRFERETLVHGLAYWFDLELAEGCTLSNAPGADPGSWGHLFLAAAPPLRVPAGEELVASAGPGVHPDGSPGWFSWHLSAGGQERRGHEFAASPASLSDLLVGSPDGVPALTRGARIEALVLGLTDGKRRIADIAQGVREQYPEFERQEAERFVTAVLRGRANARLATAATAEVSS